MTSRPTRRTVLALAGCAALAPLGARANPWAPRRPTGEEMISLQSFHIRLRRRFRPQTPDQIVLFETHVRMRMGEDLLFRPRQADLHIEGVQRMTALAEEMVRQVDVRIEIVGHHHADGQRFQAHIVSSRRATNVQAVLLSRGIPQDRLLATGLGEAFPIAPNDSAAGRAANRRVEFVVRPV
ncbi:MAG: OmpA family protein [Alkalilacustris sp.]